MSTRILLLSLLFPFVLGLYAIIHHHASPTAPRSKRVKIDGVVLPTGRHIKNFHFTDNQGHSFTNKNLLKHHTLMFFGFTNCGYICPTSMAALNQMYRQLSTAIPTKEFPQVVMVTVDPKRDSIERLNGYVKAYHPKFVGIRGNLEETRALETQMNVVAMKLYAKKDKKYTINHSANVMYIDPKGNLRAYLSYPHHANIMVRDYKAIIEALRQENAYG